jgi:hypothetical protein
VHRSRLSTLLIDAPTARAPAAAGFWSAALGVPARPEPGEEQFTDLPGSAPHLVVAVQAIDDQPATTWTSRPTTLRRRPPA